MKCPHLHKNIMINLTPNVMNKPESQYLNQTSFHDITSNNVSSGQRENVSPSSFQGEQHNQGMANGPLR